MLDPVTTVFLAERIVAFVNAPPATRARAVEETFSARPRPNRGDTSPEMEELLARDATEPPLPEYEPPQFERRPLRYYHSLQCELQDVLCTEPRRMAVRHFMMEWMTNPNRESAWTTLHGVLRFDAQGRLVMEEPRFISVADLIAVTLAELESPDARAAILKCGFSECDKFFLKKCGTGARGQPRKFCSDRCKKLHHTREKSK